MTLASIVAAGVLSGLLSWVGTNLIVRSAGHLKILDHPNERSSHSVPTPRGGGLAIVIVVLSGGLINILLYESSLSFQILLLSSAVVAVVGLVDDLRNSSKWVRLGFHFAASILVVAIGSLDNDLSSWPDNIFLMVVAVPLVVWALNLYNFMDGIDGLAAAQGAFLSFAGVALLWGSAGSEWSYSLIISGSACLGFMIPNWQPARIFMGDGGSGFLGFTLASTAFLSSLHNNIALASWVILGGTFLVDSTTTLITRMATGQDWMVAHRSHAYQKLSRTLSSHAKVTILFSVVNVLWLLPCALLAIKFPSIQWWIAAGALFPLLCVCVVVGAGKN